MRAEIDILIIGAGQAGLAAGYYLKQAEKSFLILSTEQSIGDVWRNRYDSLVLFTPRWYCALPGFRLEGDPNGFATKNEIADYLARYAIHFDLPVQLNTEIRSMTKEKEFFIVRTNAMEFIAKKVIIATGPFQKPFIPDIASKVPHDMVQIHTADYKNPSDLKKGPVLVVGAGNSGAQIAVELSADREVYLSAGHRLRFFPLRMLGQSIFWWFAKLGLLDATRESKIGQLLRRQGDPIFGLELKALLRGDKIRMKPRTLSMKQHAVTFEDGSEIEVANIIWATGFHSDYHWILINDIFNDRGMPIHDRGVSLVAGLYFLGLPWQYRRGSALIGGVGEDASHIVKAIIQEK